MRRHEAAGPKANIQPNMDRREIARKAGSVKSERKARAARINARRPKPRLRAPDHEKLAKVRAELVSGLADATPWLRQVLAGKAGDADLRMQVVRFAADRAGLPTLQQTEIKGDEQAPMVINVVGGLGWPGVGDGGGGGGGRDGGGPRP
jgi:hypothetical protein